MTKTTATAKATEIAVTTLGPNGINDATFHVHAKGCKDADNRRRYGRSERYDEMVTSMEQMTLDAYSDHIGEADYDDPDVAWTDYRAEFKVFPCVSIPESAADALAPKKTRKPAKVVVEVVQREARAKAGVWGTRAMLEWTKVDGELRAEGARYIYRVTGDAGKPLNGFYAQQRMTKGGHWSNLAGRCDTVLQAKKLVEHAEHGARWFAYSKFVGVAFADLPR